MADTDQASTNLFSASAADPQASAQQQQPTENAPSPNTATAPQPQPDSLQIPVEAQNLIGEGRKYANVQTALASIGPAQQHIANLENDNAQMKTRISELEAELTKAANLENVLATMNASQQNTAQPAVTSGMDADAVLKLLEEREAAQTAQRNQEAVTAALVQKFGDSTKATEALQHKALELGLSVDTFAKLAAQSPKAVLGYFGEGGKAQQSLVPNSSETTTTPFQAPQQQELNMVATSGTTDDLVSAFRNCGLTVNGGQEINHRY